MVGVVQQHDVPGSQPLRRPPRDRLGRRAPLPISTPARPQQRQPPTSPREQEPARAEHAVRRPVAPGLAAGGVGDDRQRAVEVARDLDRGAPEQVAVPVPVQRDLVARGGDLGGDSRPALDLLADEEERRSRIGARERLEHRARPLGMRPVVERQGDAGAIEQAAVDA